VDFMLVDIWEVALPALELVSSALRPGAIVVCDNTTAFADSYRDYFEFVNHPANRFRTMTVPFQGGLELTVRV
jgi:predicted O-methyltransferase YrrM